eukprot:jgi/Chrzof1/5686/Cz16g11200.t1
MQTVASAITCPPPGFVLGGWVGEEQSKLASCCCCLKDKLYHIHPGIYTVQTPPKHNQTTHVSLTTSHSHFSHTWHNPQFELTAQLGYLWQNLQLNTKTNPLFKYIQIDLNDPLRIQHESLPNHL